MDKREYNMRRKLYDILRKEVQPCELEPTFKLLDAVINLSIKAGKVQPRDKFLAMLKDSCCDEDCDDE